MRDDDLVLVLVRFWFFGRWRVYIEPKTNTMCIVDFIDLCITNSLLFFSFSSSGKYKKALNRGPKTKNPSSSEQGEAAPSENLKQGSAQKKRLGQKFRFSFCLANGFLSLFSFGASGSEFNGRHGCQMW